MKRRYLVLVEALGIVSMLEGESWHVVDYLYYRWRWWAGLNTLCGGVQNGVAFRYRIAGRVTLK